VRTTRTSVGVVVDGAATTTAAVSLRRPAALDAVTRNLPSTVSALKLPTESIVPPVALHDTVAGAAEESRSLAIAANLWICPAGTVTVSGTIVRLTMGMAGWSTEVTSTRAVSLNSRPFHDL
jgi:hypothetical protein